MLLQHIFHFCRCEAGADSCSNILSWEACVCDDWWCCVESLSLFATDQCDCSYSTWCLRHRHNGERGECWPSCAQSKAEHKINALPAASAETVDMMSTINSGCLNVWSMVMDSPIWVLAEIARDFDLWGITKNLKQFYDRQMSVISTPRAMLGQIFAT